MPQYDLTPAGLEWPDLFDPFAYYQPRGRPVYRYRVGNERPPRTRPGSPPFARVMGNWQLPL